MKKPNNSSISYCRCIGYDLELTFLAAFQDKNEVFRKDKMDLMRKMLRIPLTILGITVN
jgi:hypothetical protein